MKRHAALTSTYTNVVDIGSMLLRQSPSGAQPAPLRRIARGVLIALVGSLCLMPEAGGSKPVQYVSYKEYAYYALGYNTQQYKCLSILWGKESAWNPKAIGNLTGTHRVYGIPQGKSEYLATLNGYEQIQWGLKYIQHHRIYQGDTCKALDHWRRKGWH